MLFRRNSTRVPPKSIGPVLQFVSALASVCFILSGFFCSLFDVVQWFTTTLLICGIGCLILLCLLVFTGDGL